MYQYPRPRDNFIPNHRALYNQDTRNVFSGKDAMIWDEDGTLLSTVESFQAKVNVATTNYQPLGSPISQAFITGYSLTIAITQCIIESDKIFRDLANMFHKGRHSPHWVFQSVIYGYDGSSEHLAWKDCVPDGDWDIHNFSIGDIIKRQLNLRCNSAPQLIRSLSYE